MLFAVFVMASVAMISLTVGFFAIEEIRASRAVALSEPAITAAETAGEEGLWLMKRGGVVGDCSSGQTRDVLNSSKTITSRCLVYESAVVTIKPSEAFIFYLYDSNNINGNLNPGYQNIVITYVSGALSATVQVSRLDGAAVSTTNVFPGNPVTINLPTSPTDDNRFKVSITSTGTLTLDVNTNLGMPDFPTLEAEGCAAGSADISSCGTNLEAFKRRLHILLPK